MSQKGLREIIRQHYASLLDLCISCDGNNVVAIDSFCRFFCFPASASSFPFYWDVNFIPLCLNTLTNSFLTCGDSKGYVRTYQWSSILEYAYKSNEKVVTEYFKLADSNINDILFLSSKQEDCKIVACCGDGKIKLGDMERKKELCSFTGHSEEVNKLAMPNKTFNNGFEFASCSSDGFVYLWDFRIGKKPARTLNIGRSKKFDVARPNFSKGIYAMDIDDDFLVCGGGIDLGMWHLSSGSLVYKLVPNFGNSKTDNYQDSESQTDTNAIIYQAVKIHNGQILAGGRSNGLKYSNTKLQRFNYIGEDLHSLKFNGISGIRSISSFKNSNAALIAGDSCKIFHLSDTGFLSHSTDTSVAIAACSD